MPSEFKVSIRDGFSDRNGFKKINKLLQTDYLDERSRTMIINLINLLYTYLFKCYPDEETLFWQKILSNVYVKEVKYNDRYQCNSEQMFEIINETIRYDPYDDVISLVEYIVSEMKAIDTNNRFKVDDVVNKSFEKEYIGYRYIGKHLVKITNEQETSSINETFSIPVNSVNEHMEKAISLFSDRNNPDYANTIKESISAVEAMCTSIVGKSDSLGNQLNMIEKKGIIIHPALKSAFEKLYGYTSDVTGIRHAGKIDGENATFDEAKFMLVTCSAFINYLKGILHT